MSKSVAIMQPYFLPYMGYWQLLNTVDEFVIYDNIQYTKKGWINRNRFLLNGRDEMFTLPLQADATMLNVDKRFLSPDFDRSKFIRQLQGAYRKAPFYRDHFAVIEDIINCPEQNLFCYILNAVEKIAAFLEITTPLVISSTIPIDHDDLKGADKVMAICKARAATTYINPIGGVDLYDKTQFQRQGIALEFLRSRPLHYTCFDQPAIPYMSILDVMMFMPRLEIVAALDAFDRE